MCRCLCVALILSICVNSSVACGGYKLRINSIDNCGGDSQIVTVDKNFTVTLSPSCDVTTAGCVTSKGFAKATAKYTVLKNGMTMMSGTADLCDRMSKESKEMKDRMAMFGVPTECPVAEGKTCINGDQKLNISKYKAYLNLANGKLEVRADITHDTGKTCLKMKFDIYK